MRCLDPVEDTTVVGGDIMLMIYCLICWGCYVDYYKLSTKGLSLSEVIKCDDFSLQWKCSRLRQWKTNTRRNKLDLIVCSIEQGKGVGDITRVTIINLLCKLQALLALLASDTIFMCVHVGILLWEWQHTWERKTMNVRVVSCTYTLYLLVGKHELPFIQFKLNA